MDAFEAFFRDHHRSLIRIAMYAGASQDEARGAAQDTMAEVARRWEDIDNPLAYARKAVINHFRKARRDSLEKIRVHMARNGAGTPEAHSDQALTVWEDEQWVRQQLDTLTAKQREVMELVLKGLEPREIAVLLGRSSDAVRQNLREARNRLRPAVEQHRTTYEAAGVVRKES